MSADQRVISAREYLASVRQHKVTALPPSVLVRECGELRRQLGQVLDAIGQAEPVLPDPGHTLNGTGPAEIRGSRTASGTDPGGVTTIVPNDLGTVLGALADAATFHEERVTSWCTYCAVHPAGLCEEHAGNLDAVARYRSLGRALGDDRA